MLVRPFDGLVQICDQMDDRRLATLVTELRVPAMDQVQHHGPKAEIERRALTHAESWVTSESQLIQSASLDGIHSDHRAVRGLLSNNSVGPDEPARCDRT